MAVVRRQPRRGGQGCCGPGARQAFVTDATGTPKAALMPHFLDEAAKAQIGAVMKATGPFHSRLCLQPGSPVSAHLPADPGLWEAGAGPQREISMCKSLGSHRTFREPPGTPGRHAYRLGQDRRGCPKSPDPR